ncbi:hypothetical protein K439DRAFT_1086903 [Ramaria rubella]|nr:hypothetical protein K439DRAFT_1086903 [Ramaria rubella]
MAIHWITKHALVELEREELKSRQQRSKGKQGNGNDPMRHNAPRLGWDKGTILNSEARVTLPDSSHVVCSSMKTEE